MNENLERHYAIEVCERYVRGEATDQDLAAAAAAYDAANREWQVDFLRREFTPNFRGEK